MGNPVPRVELRHSWGWDLGVTLALGGLVTASGLSQRAMSPASCRLCDGDGGEVNGLDGWFRDALRRNDTTPASTTSHIVAYGVAPLASLGLQWAVAADEQRADEVPLDMLLTAEAVLGAVALNEGLKLAFARERPYLHAMTDPEAKQRRIDEGDTLTSFPSGHTTATFAMAAAGGTIATLRGYRLAPLVWIVGGALALTTGYLRMAADRHYFTDVLAGAAVGTGMGIGIPLLFHRPVNARPSAALEWLYTARVATSEVPGGRTVALGWTF